MTPIAVDLLASDDTEPATLIRPLDVNGVKARRDKAPKLIGGLAAAASSEMFKGPQEDKPFAISWDHRFSEESSARHQSTIKGAAKFLKTPGLISLGGGLPSSEYIPFAGVDIRVPMPPGFTEEETITIPSGKNDMAEGISIYDINVAFNYAQATGSPQLLRFITEHTEMVHNPPYADWRCSMTVGSTSGLDMAFRMFTSKGDCLIVEEYTFATAMETAAPMGVTCAGVAMDDQGLLPASLDDLLSTWDPAKHGGKKRPWLLYTVPNGQNPTGVTQSAQRRKDIYDLAQKWDLYIIEDDPYYFLQMAPYTPTPLSSTSSNPARKSSHTKFLSSLLPSYLSLDTSGRVLRLDSFAKVIAPGARLGWITAPASVIDRFVYHGDVSTQNPSGISQLLLFKILEEAWGHSGYLDWLIYLRTQYTRRRDVICTACEEFLPKELCAWKVPQAGMFQFVEIRGWREHPQVRSGEIGREEVEEEIFQENIRKGVLCHKGSWFRAESEEENRQIFFRLTFAAAPAGEVREGVRRFGEAIRSVFGLSGGKDGVENGE